MISWCPRAPSVGSFYALPQSPQLFKQLLMVGGLERYYQIVRCFRDEDSRADRMTEFTQLDIEMAFVAEDDVLELMEAVFGAVFLSEGFDVPAPPWPRITWAEAMSRWGSDRPDRRFGLELHDLSQAVASSEFQVFSGALAEGGGTGAVLGLNAGARELPRSDLDALTEFAKQYGAQRSGLGVRAGGRHRCARRSRSSSPRVRLLAIKEKLAAQTGDVLFIVADAPRDRASGAGGAAARARAPLLADPRGCAARRALGRRVPDVRRRR